MPQARTLSSTVTITIMSDSLHRTPKAPPILLVACENLLSGREERASGSFEIHCPPRKFVATPPSGSCASICRRKATNGRSFPLPGENSLTQEAQAAIFTALLL